MKSDYIEENLETLSKLEPGQKLYIRMGMIKIDKNPKRIYRWFTGDSKVVVFSHLDNMIDLAISFSIPLDLQLLDALENYKITYNHRKDITDNINKLQKKISDAIN
jgi:hypothetical protein